MELKELHHLAFKEMGVDPNLLNKIESRTDNIIIKYARAIFCRVARESGYKSGEIADYINRDFGIVNKDIRDLRDIEWQKDFISTAIIEGYYRVLNLVKSE